MTVWATLKFEADNNGRKSTSPPSPIGKLFTMAMTLMVFPVTMHLPAAVLCWWVTTSAISLAEVAALELPEVRQFFNIDPFIVHPPGDLLMSQKKVVMKADKDHMKICREVDQRQRYDEKWFVPTRWGPKIYKYDPTKASGAVQAQKK